MDKKLQKINELFKPWDNTYSPGGAVAVISNGEVIYKRGFGMANLEHGIINKPSSIFYIASVSKQFAAMCMALLDEQGTISLDDTLDKYFPEMPDYAKTVKIRHLVHHTSGLKDFLSLLMFSGRTINEMITDNDALSIIVRQKSLNFEPGERFLYSNSGYFLMSQLILRTTGMSMREYGDKYIFKPLGMKSAHFHDNHLEPIPLRSTGYSIQKDGKYVINIPNLDTVGSGGIYASVEDFIHWDQNFYNNQLGNKQQSLIDTFLTGGVLNDGTQIKYAFGINNETYKGVKMYSHSGGFGAYSGHFVQFPDQKVSVVCLSNSNTLSAPSLAMRAADILLEDYLQKDVKKEESASTAVKGLSEQQQEKYSGLYLSQEQAMSWKLVPHADSLALNLMSENAPDFPLTRVDDTKFECSAPVSISVDFTQFEKTNSVEIGLAGRPPSEFEKVTPVPFKKEILVGNYYSEELDGKAEIFSKDDTVNLRLGHNESQIFPGKENQLILAEGFIETTRNSDGEIDGFLLHNSRAKNLIFKKI